MTKKGSVVCLDVGEKRIGVAVGDLGMRIAVPYDTINVDGSELDMIANIISRESANKLVIGYPRNQSGEATAQTRFVEDFARKLKDLDVEIIFQDESLTSVMAEQRLISYNRPYKKEDIDAQAAAIILQDFFEAKNV